MIDSKATETRRKRYDRIAPFYDPFKQSGLVAHVAPLSATH